MRSSPCRRSAARRTDSCTSPRSLAAFGIRIDLEEFDSIGRRVPVLVDLEPSSDHYMEHLHDAGGLNAVLRELRAELRTDTLTVSGRTLGENIEIGDRVPGQTVVRTRSDPIHPSGGMAVLRGNLAPSGAVIKHSAASPRLLEHTGRAVVFDSLEDLAARVDDPDLDVELEDVLVLRGSGPKGAPGMPEAGYIPIPKKLAARGVKDMVRLSDARMSGTAFGTIVLHVTPESAIGGPLALVETGDRIRLDVGARRLNLLLPEKEIAARRERWSQPRLSRGRSAATSAYSSTPSPEPTAAAISISWDATLPPSRPRREHESSSVPHCDRHDRPRPGSTDAEVRMPSPGIRVHCRACCPAGVPRRGARIVNNDTRLLSPFSSAGFVPCRNARYALRSAILLLFAIGGTANGQALAASEPALEDQLLEIKKNKVVILSKINQLPSHVAGEVDRIMGVMDKLMANEVSKLVDDHYLEVEKALQRVSLPENIGALKVYWESIKSGTGYDRTGIDALVQDFLRRAQAVSEPSQEKLAEDIENTLNEALSTEMIQARKIIRVPFQRLISTRFPELAGSKLARAVLSDTSRTGGEGLVR